MIRNVINYEFFLLCTRDRFAGLYFFFCHDEIERENILMSAHNIGKNSSLGLAKVLISDEARSTTKKSRFFTCKLAVIDDILKKKIAPKTLFHQNEKKLDAKYFKTCIQFVLLYSLPKKDVSLQKKPKS